MLKDLVKETAEEIGTTQKQARAVLGIVLSTAERQGSEFAAALFKKLPGARTLSARTHDDLGAPSDTISRLIEQTPGGRRHVAQEMIRSLQQEGLGHAEIGALLPTISRFAAEKYGLEGMGHLGDIIGSPSMEVDDAKVAAAA
jgi:hypothetical protein